MTALLQIGPGDDAIVHRLHDVEVVSDAAQCDVAIIDSQIDAPVQVARRIHADAPDAHIVFLTTPANDATLRRELRIGRIGTQWSIAPADRPDDAAGVVREAIQFTERRRRLRSTIGRVNLQLAQKVVPARRTVISDHFLALVLEQLSDAVVVLDPARVVLAWNGAAARAFGEIRRGVEFGETLPVEARDAIQAALEAAEGRAASTLEANGIAYGLRATVLRDGRDDVIGIAVVARDITAMRREERQRQLLADAVRALTSTLVVREALQRLVDLLVEDFVDVAAADIVEGEDVHRHAVAARAPHERALMDRSLGGTISRNRHHPSYAAVMRGETVLVNEIDDALLERIATSEAHLSAMRELHLRGYVVVPLRGGDETVGAIAVARTTGGPFTPADVILLQELARQAASALHNIWAFHAAEEAGRLKDEFLATLSHELRTPMTSILGWAQILRLDDTPEDLVRDGLESIERSARAQAQLIDDLLDLSRMQMGKVQFHARAFSLTAVVRAAADTVRPTAQARGVALEVDAEQEIVVNGDPDRMQQVIWNLLSNAVKFSDSGKEVRISVTADGRCAHVSVADRGRGIAPDFLPHVFDRFRQADAATTRRYGGLGLGLAIVKQLVEMHGGTVQATSPGLGRGATFTITVPLPAQVRIGPPKEEAPQPARLPDLSDVCLLVVEDDPASAKALCAILERAGADVRTTHSVAAALESLRDRIPHVLISDVAMPDEDGLALIRAIRGRLHISNERMPAVALTAFHDVDLRVTLLGAGFQRFMTKPVDAQALAEVVATLARRGRR
ncbi:MAG TPA: ATP-binding protein [Thermoanaerobaculia bacterium]|nr:ATP-binding protein [Thermoanaerobaculia bacterium]